MKHETSQINDRKHRNNKIDGAGYLIVVFGSKLLTQFINKIKTI